MHSANGFLVIKECLKINSQVSLTNGINGKLSERLGTYAGRAVFSIFCVITRAIFFIEKNYIATE